MDNSSSTLEALRVEWRSAMAEGVAIEPRQIDTANPSQVINELRRIQKARKAHGRQRRATAEAAGKAEVDARQSAEKKVRDAERAEETERRDLVRTEEKSRRDAERAATRARQEVERAEVKRRREVEKADRERAKEAELLTRFPHRSNRPTMMSTSAGPVVEPEKGYVQYGLDKHPLPATAEVTTTGFDKKRVTATRVVAGTLLLPGIGTVAGAAARKGKSMARTTLVVSGEGWVFSHVEEDDDGRKAAKLAEFAAYVNSLPS